MRVNEKLSFGVLEVLPTSEWGGHGFTSNPKRPVEHLLLNSVKTKDICFSSAKVVGLNPSGLHVNSFCRNLESIEC